MRRRSARREVESESQEDYERSLLAHWIPYFVGAGLAVGYLVWVLGAESYSAGWIVAISVFALFPFALGYLCARTLVSVAIAYVLTTGVHVRREYGPVTRLGVGMAVVCRGLLGMILLDLGFFDLGGSPGGPGKRKGKGRRKSSRAAPSSLPTDGKP